MANALYSLIILTIEKYIEDVGWDRELLFMQHTQIISNFKTKSSLILKTAKSVENMQT